MSRNQSHFLNTFFYPQSVAVVGATNNTSTLNYNLFGNLVNLKFPGRIYPVNPRAKEIMGIKAYPDLKSIEGEVDLAIVAVPASKALDVVRDCVARKVKGVVLVSGGFSEIGEGGRRVQDEIKRLLQENGIRATGPNTLGPINSANNFVVSFRAVERLVPGKLSFIFQSGLYDPRINWMVSEFGLRLSKLIDLGNKMDTTETDALEYLGQDPETGVIAIHLESIAGDGRKFLRLLKQICREKPVIILKSARTPAGAKAAASHTGAIIRSSDAVFDTVMKQSGAIRAQTLDDLFDLGKVFEYLYPITGNRVHVSTGPGGEGVLATDLCQYNGLSMAQLNAETYEKLRAIFPSWNMTVNPFDLGVSIQFNDVTSVFNVMLTAVPDDPNVDCLAMQVRLDRFKDADRFITLITDSIKRGKPVVLWMTVMPHGNDTIIQRLESHQIPVYPSGDRAIKALAALYKYGKWREGRE